MRLTSSIPMTSRSIVPVASALRHEGIAVEICGGEWLFDCARVQEDVGGFLPICLAHPAIGLAFAVLRLQPRNGLLPLQLDRFPPVLGGTGQSHGDVDAFLEVLRLDDIVQPARRRPYKTRHKVRLLRNRLLVNDNALPEGSDAELLELHEAQRFAFALTGADHEV